MSIVNTSLLAESGNTARVAKLLQDEPAIGAFLKTIPVRGKTTLLATVQRWIDAGASLGKLEREREEQEASESTQAVGKGGVNALRSRWIRLVSLMLTNLEVTEAAPGSVEVLRGPVLKASERAAKRYEGGGAEVAARSRELLHRPPPRPESPRRSVLSPAFPAPNQSSLPTPRGTGLDSRSWPLRSMTKPKPQDPLPPASARRR